MLKHLVLAEETDRLDICDEYVAIGPYAIQNGIVFGISKNVKGTKAILEEICSVPGVHYDVRHEGVRRGWGHGREILEIMNADGSMIYRVTRIDHCDGPGYDCSYSHGPWIEYGEYKGDATPDPELLEALEIKRRLEKKYKF